MIKTLLSYFLVFFGLYFLAFNLHENYVVKNSLAIPYSLQKVYQFHLGFSLLICVNFKLLSTVDKMFDQLGFIYLGTLILKMVLFFIAFYNSVFLVENLSQFARISLLIPALIFLLTEVIFVAKILNEKQNKKIP